MLQQADTKYQSLNTKQNTSISGQKLEEEIVYERKYKMNEIMFFSALECLSKNNRG